jgi:DNA-binding beta-propeller fold protein YncE
MHARSLLLRRPVWAIIAIILGSMFLASCGGSYNGSTPNLISGLTKRAFVSNTFANAIDIVDAANDVLNSHRIIPDPGPKVMALSPDKKLSLVFSTSSNHLDVINNATEAQVGAVAVQDVSESFFFLPDSRTVYVAVRNSGLVIKWDTVVGSTVGVSAPNARWIVRSNNGNTVLAFPDDSSNTVYVIDTTATTPVAVAVTGFDRPVWAVFSSDDSKAYVMNCGPECGGTTAGVQILNLPAKTLGASVAVPGATHAVLNNSTLYVAGTPPARACVGNTNETNGCGTLSKIDVSSGLGTPAAPVEINNGFHDHMLLGPNNKIFVGAEFTCTVKPTNGNGCLSIYNTSAGTATIVAPCDSACGGLNDVTGMTNITGRNVVYVIEGGELHIYDAATDAMQSRQVDTTGRSWDVVSPD